MTDEPRYPRLRLGTAPDSWGVWFADDPRQTRWSRYLDEARAAGYRWTELGPFGYLPTDPSRLSDELAARDLTLTGGTVSAALHRGPAALDAAKRACIEEAGTITPLGARHLVLLPEGYTDADGGLDQPAELTDDEWAALNDGMSELGRFVRDELGCELVVHSHADTHIATPAEIERLFAGTDPDAVRFCLDTGHVAYCGGDPLEIIRSHPDRITYVHLKSVDPAVRGRVVAEGLDFGTAVKLGAMVEPERGEPAMPPVLEALGALDRDIFCIVEQDLYPCPPDVPLPIATRTFEYYAGQGLRTTT
ncbi:MAG TPA: TIM barrel protein [Candidatus Limnocylindrales bacterium]|nr:TIM barrel protein [Candidatus Limnocylindrales bacterium]